MARARRALAEDLVELPSVDKNVPGAPFAHRVAVPLPQLDPPSAPVRRRRNDGPLPGDLPRESGIEQRIVILWDLPLLPCSQGGFRLCGEDSRGSRALCC